MDLTGIGTAFDFAKGVMDRFWPKQASEAEKLAALSALAPMIQERDDGLIQAKRDIIVAEMNQGDNFTKRARPSVIYMGLAFIGMVHVIVPCITKLIVAFKSTSITAAQLTAISSIGDISLPSEFWIAWGSVVSIYSLGRSAEKRGSVDKIVSMITGKK